MKITLLVVAVAILATTGAVAGIEPLEGCEDSEGTPVPTRNDFEQAQIVRARVGEEGPFIAVNYELAARVYLGRHTLRWLYFRECAHIVLKHEPLDRPSPASQEAADCWALQRIFEERDEYEARTFTKTITRDLKELEPSMWEKLRLGNRRDPDIEFRCKPFGGREER